MHYFIRHIRKIGIFWMLRNVIIQCDYFMIFLNIKYVFSIMSILGLDYSDQFSINIIFDGEKRYNILSNITHKTSLTKTQRGYTIWWNTI